MRGRVLRPDPSSELDPPGSAETVTDEREIRGGRAFDEAVRAFEDAATAAGETIERSYLLADRCVRFLFAGPAMVPRFTPAFAHLPDGAGVPPSLVVRVWDARSTGSPPPPIPPTTVRQNTSPRFVYRAGPVHGIAQPVEGGMSLFDAERGEATYWAVDADAVPYYETAAPIRHILSWWAGVEGRPLVHAGAVGRPGGGILLVGRGGSGKSTTALACLNSELSYLGDDYVLVEIEPSPVAHTLYSSGKLQPDNTQRLQHLRHAISNVDRLPEEKAVIFVAEHFPAKIARTFPIRAIVVPTIGNRARPRIRPAASATALAAMAPSTILQLPGTGQESLDAMARLLAKVPAFSLDLAEDMAANVRAIGELIDSLMSEGR